MTFASACTAAPAPQSALRRPAAALIPFAAFSAGPARCGAIFSTPPIRANTDRVRPTQSQPNATSTSPTGSLAAALLRLHRRRQRLQQHRIASGQRRRRAALSARQLPTGVRPLPASDRPGSEIAGRLLQPGRLAAQNGHALQSPERPAAGRESVQPMPGARSEPRRVLPRPGRAAQRNGPATRSVQAAEPLVGREPEVGRPENRTRATAGRSRPDRTSQGATGRRAHDRSAQRPGAHRAGPAPRSIGRPRASAGQLPALALAQSLPAGSRRPRRPTARRRRRAGRRRRPRPTPRTATRHAAGRCGIRAEAAGSTSTDRPHARHHFNDRPAEFRQIVRLAAARRSGDRRPPARLSKSRRRSPGRP